MTSHNEDHAITVTPTKGRVQVRFGGQVIAETVRALSVQDGSNPPVQYILREDTRIALLERTTLKTGCVHKGEASYFSIRAGDKFVENAVWSYETPPAEFSEIAGRLAFYMVDSIDVE
jgi:uncharacterized protein (DUF427 family)